MREDLRKRILKPHPLYLPNNNDENVNLQAGSATLSSMHTTGVLMLFSAGTFLYVATVHVLPEIVTAESASPQQSANYLPLSREEGAKEPGVVGNETLFGITNSSEPQSPSFGHSHAHGGVVAFRLNELAALVGGALVPMLLSIGHSH